MKVLALDQGTSSTKAVLVDDGEIAGRASAPVGCSYPRPGWVEQDAEEIWRSVLAVIAALDTPDAIALTNQRESAVVWDDEYVSPVIGWQDARTAAECERLRDCEPLVRARTGLALDPMFSATKLAYLHRDGLRAGTLDAFLIHRLTGEFATEAGNASRTLLFNLETLAWDPELCELFGVPLEALPQVRRSDAGFGVTADGIPVRAVLADSHAALYAHGAAKATYGTGSSVMVPSDAAVDSLAHTLAWLTDEPTYAVEGNIVASGAALDWMARVLGGPVEPLASTVPDTGGVHLVPAFSGLGAPHWDRHADGLISGLTLGTRPEHLARAAFESVAHQVCDILDLVELDALHADGGATSSDLLMQLQADLSGLPVLASESPEMSALGVADLAAGVRHVRPAREFHPRIGADERAARREAWHAAVRRSRETKEMTLS
jgi:glycerol kinase